MAPFKVIGAAVVHVLLTYIQGELGLVDPSSSSEFKSVVKSTQLVLMFGDSLPG